ncbi:chorismate mutase [Sporolactobacillus inulinus]|uniref:Chorismate mutase domain-containing protein n=1 Tax=Sporolactobacillus inulinus CASD TaxID=1069536 RepID=A0A0U1QNL7_9BACL|nr:chorismate mutase [Sporolactobacillus inulinus]KLI02372.1 hypothetical protein SINU_08410 [Sporolactobacillus inulinus CASD]GEB78276.1 hypothetical protein SIN01_26210 [Sporolactobacillus inulinus]
MNQLQAYRKEIDAIDEQLIHLFNERMDIARSIALFKLKNDHKILDGKREQDIIRKARDQSARAELRPYQESLFKHLVTLSRDYQKLLINKCK